MRWMIPVKREASAVPRRLQFGAALTHGQFEDLNLFGLPVLADADQVATARKRRRTRVG